MKKFFSLIFLVTLLLLAFVIGNYNNTPVTVHFLIVQTQWPLAAVMALMIACGFIFGFIGALIVGMGKANQGKDKQQNKQESQNKVADEPEQVEAAPDAPLHPAQSKS